MSVQNELEFQFVDELLAESFPINQILHWNFKNYYLCGEDIYFLDESNILRTCLKHPCGPRWSVWMRDTLGILRKVYVKRIEAEIGKANGIVLNLN